MIRVKQTALDTGYRALPTLRRVAGRMVRLIARWLLVCGLCLLWYLSLAGVALGQAGSAPDAKQSPWRLGEITELQSWYWGEVPKVPMVRGGYSICVPITGGQRCVLVAQGQYRYLIADGLVVEDSRYRLRLLQVWR